MVVATKRLIDYIDDGYTVVVHDYGFERRIKGMYPQAIVTNSRADGIGGERLLVDSWARGGAGLKAALGKYKDTDVVYEKFTHEFVNGKSIVSKNQELTMRDINFDLSNEVPKLFIKGQEVGVVSFSSQYVTSNANGHGTNTVTIGYITKAADGQRTLSINKVTDEVFHQ